MGKDTAPRKLFYQQWSRNWLFFSGKGREARWSTFSVLVRGCSWNSCFGNSFGRSVWHWLGTGPFNLLEVFKNLSGLVIAWPDEPIKALCVYYSCDIKLLHEGRFIERLASVKKLINIWSSRGLSIYGKVTIIKSLIIPKFVYISLLLPVPKEIVKELNQMIFQFSWWSEFRNVFDSRGEC